MGNSFKPFNYYNYNEAAEEIIINQDATQRPVFSKIFDLLSKILMYILCVSFPLDIYFKYFYNEAINIGGIDLIAANSLILQITGAFRIFMYVFFILSYLFFEFKMGFASLINQKIDRYCVILAWMSYCYYILQTEPLEHSEAHFYALSTVTAIMITSATYILLTILMFFFEDSFIKRTLKLKIGEVSRTEEILKKLKKYAYETVETEEPTDAFCKLGEVFYLDLDSWTGERFDSSPAENNSFRNLKEPEIFNLRDAYKLSRAIFLKSSSTPYSLTKDNFIEIFGDEQYANEVFTEFDINHSQKISKENFRNTLACFFRQRALLSKSLVSMCSFINIIKRIVYVTAFILLLIVFLVLFGTGLKELFALVVSSALVMNFIGSGAITDLWKNIMFLFSHQFDIGDEVILDDREMIVHDIGLISSSFLLSNGGAIKVINSDLWNKTIVNMTKAPEKVLPFSLNLPADITQEQMNSLKYAIFKFVKDRPFEFYDTFVVGSSSSDCSSIKQLETSILLKFKNHTNRSKKFTTRAEFTAYLRDFLKQNEICKL